jgi:NHL repeat-containing protein
MTPPCSEAEIRRGALLIRSRVGDTVDARPIVPCRDDASPDLMLAGGEDEETAFFDHEHQVRVRVTNGGDRPLADINVEAWIALSDAAAPLGQLDPPGRLTGFAPGPLAPGATIVIACSPGWTPTTEALGKLGDGDLWMAANAWADTPHDGAELTGAAVLKPCCNTHHAQRTVVLRFRPTDIITTLVGGELGFEGDGGPAVNARFRRPFGLALLPDGGYLISDTGNHRVRSVAPDGRIRTVAGTGEAAFAGDGGPATAAALDSPIGLAVLPDGGFLIAESGNHIVRRVGADGRIATVAGSGRRHGFAGDGGPATAARLTFPQVVAPLPGGGFLIADGGNRRVRRVAADGTIATVAGTDAPAGPEEGAPATATRLLGASAVAALPDGGLLVSDGTGNRVRRVFPDGTMRTVAGTGFGPFSGFSGEGAAATAAQISSPGDLLLTPDGGFLVALTSRVLRVRRDGRIFTVAGGGPDQPGTLGDGGSAREARLRLPSQLAIRADGSLMIADTDNHRIRLVQPGWIDSD